MNTQQNKCDQISMTAWLDMIERLRATLTCDDKAPVEMIQTHISMVLLTRRLVLKLKKPVDFGFLDYSTIAKRRAACETEVRLNRRLCANVYLGVQPVVEREGELHLTGEGRVLDYAVLMKRLPAAKMLDFLVENRKVTTSTLDRVAARLADFHAATQRRPEIDEYGSAASIRHNWEENFAQTTSYIGRTISAEKFAVIRGWIEDWLDENKELLQSRVRAGRICDGHGDVRCESICVLDDTSDGLCIFDCIEFNERFRYGDVAGEVAFLAMDLDARGRPDLGYLFTEQYSAHAGEDQLFALLPFYRCYRAFVRGKVLSFRLDEAEFSAAEKEDASLRARYFFDLAARYATPLSTPTVIAIGGLSGTGKSTLARAIASELGLRVIASDAIRAELFGENKTPAAYGEGCYSESANHLVYEMLLQRGRERLQADGSVILDATFSHAAVRAAAQKMANETGASWRLIMCDAPSETVRARLTRRTAQGEELSDADWSVHCQQREQFGTPSDSGEGNYLLLDARGDVATVGHTATDWLRTCERNASRLSG